MIAPNVFAGNFAAVSTQVKVLLDKRVDPQEIISKGLVAGMNIVAPKFKSGEMFTPEVLMSAKCMSAGIELVKSVLTENDIQSKGKIILGTVKGDLHDIGKNLVGMMMESYGFRVIDLGVDNSPDKFVETIEEHKPAIIALSALLTTTMIEMKRTVALVKNKNMPVKCIVGGAPVSQEFAEEIGADGYAANATSAAELCIELLQ